MIVILLSELLKCQVCSNNFKWILINVILRNHSINVVLDEGRPNSSPILVTRTKKDWRTASTRKGIFWRVFQKCLEGVMLTYINNFFEKQMIRVRYVDLRELFRWAPKMFRGRYVNLHQLLFLKKMFRGRYVNSKS